MLKKRAKEFFEAKSGRLMCTRLDIESEPLPHDGGYSRHPFGEGACHAGMGRRQHKTTNQTAPRATSPMLRRRQRLTLRDRWHYE
jgi:hypothetical protein